MADGEAKRSFPPFTELVIAHNPGESSCLLMRHGENGSMADTFHLNLDDAMLQAEWQFEVKPEEWLVIDEQYGF